jgi:hypothetical protein
MGSLPCLFLAFDTLLAHVNLLAARCWHLGECSRHRSCWLERNRVVPCVGATSSLLPSTLLIVTPVIAHRYNPINSATILAGSLIGSHCLDSFGRGVCITNGDPNVSIPPTIPSRSMHLSGADLYAVVSLTLPIQRLLRDSLTYHQSTIETPSPTAILGWPNS